MSHETIQNGAFSPSQNNQFSSVLGGFSTIALIMGFICGLFTTAMSCAYLWSVTTTNGIQGTDFLITIGGSSVLLAFMWAFAYVGFKILPVMNAMNKRSSIVGYFVLVLLVATLSYLSSLLAMATPAAEVSYLDRSMSNAITVVNEKSEAWNKLRAKGAIIKNKKAATTELLRSEMERGAVSGTSGGTGKTSSVISGILSSLTEAEKVLVQMDGRVAGINRRITTIEDKIVTLGQSDLTYEKKAAELAHLLTALSVLSGEFSENMPVDLIYSTSEAMALNFEAIGLSEQAVNTLTPFMHNPARQLTEGLASINEAREKTIREFEMKSGFDLVISEFEAIALIALLCLLIELASPCMVALNLSINAGAQSYERENQAATPRQIEPAPQMMAEAVTPATPSSIVTPSTTPNEPMRPFVVPRGQ